MIDAVTVGLWLFIFLMVVVLIYYVKTSVERDRLKQMSEVITKDKNSKNKYATWALVLGILSMFFATTVVVPVSALIVGFLGTQEAYKQEGKGKGLSLAGMVLGTIYIAVAFYTYGLAE